MAFASMNLAMASSSLPAWVSLMPSSNNFHRLQLGRFFLQHRRTAGGSALASVKSICSLAPSVIRTSVLASPTPSFDAVIVQLPGWRPIWMYSPFLLVVTLKRRAPLSLSRG